jgi:hypothetical protein
MHMLRSLALAAGLAVASVSASAASAGVVLTDNFDAENGGASALNYTGFAKWTVQTGQRVDLVHNGDFGTTGSGSYVDLDGSPGPGQIFSKQVFTYAAGDLITIDFDMSGSQRSTALDFWYTGLFDLNPAGNGATNRVVSVDGVPLDLPNLSGVQSLTTAVGFFGTTPFSPVEVSFNVTHAGSGVFFFGSTSADGVGPLLDNVSISIDGVPEPASWGLMIAGFGLAGAALRRRRAAVAA